VAPAVLPPELALEQARVVERRQQLGNGRPGDPRATRELCAGYALALDRSQREVLRDRQRRFALSEQPLDPPRRERRNCGERLDGLVSIWAWWGNR
jgi:hypothetical protein